MTETCGSGEDEEYVWEMADSCGGAGCIYLCCE